MTNFPGEMGLRQPHLYANVLMGREGYWRHLFGGKNHYYLAKKTEDSIDMFRYMENLRYVEYVGSQRASKSTLLLVPDAGTILADKLPAQAPFYQAAGAVSCCRFGMQADYICRHSAGNE